tara:strand:+ start:100 stop:1245 length:1146 start_codon:yes stop_codon:yes gene_type:complete
MLEHLKLLFCKKDVNFTLLLNMNKSNLKKIIHVDMDAFFASVEQLDFPELRNKPIVVGGSGRGGVVAAASYEARVFGVHSAMSGSLAAKKCPGLIFMPSRFERYREISQQIRVIFNSYTDLVEPLSLDEAYLDVTYNKQKISSAIKIAQLIRKEINARTGLTASAGVSFNKFLAKVASDLEKPNGLSVILPEQAKEFLKQLAIEKFHGIGSKTAEEMHAMGISKGSDLLNLSKVELTNAFGKSGNYFYKMVRAEDEREVNPHRIRKSIGAENTFSSNLINEIEVEEQLLRIHSTLNRRIQKHQKKGRTITLKVKYNDFQIKTHSKSLLNSTMDAAIIWQTVMEIVQERVITIKPIRLLGITLSNLDQSKKPVSGQLTLTFN